MDDDARNVGSGIDMAFWKGKYPVGIDDTGFGIMTVTRDYLMLIMEVDSKSEGRFTLRMSSEDALSLCRQIAEMHGREVRWKDGPRIVADDDGEEHLVVYTEPNGGWVDVGDVMDKDCDVP